MVIHKVSSSQIEKLCPVCALILPLVKTGKAKVSEIARILQNSLFHSPTTRVPRNLTFFVGLHASHLFHTKSYVHDKDLVFEIGEVTKSVPLNS